MTIRTRRLRALRWWFAAAGVLCACGHAGEEQHGGREASAREYTVAEVDALQAAGRRVVLIDVRDPAEFTAGHIPGARNIPLDELAAAASLDSGIIPITVCNRGNRSSRGAGLLVDMGYGAAGFLPLEAWREAGRPVEEGAPDPAAR